MSSQARYQLHFGSVSKNAYYIAVKTKRRFESGPAEDLAYLDGNAGEVLHPE